MYRTTTKCQIQLREPKLSRRLLSALCAIQNTQKRQKTEAKVEAGQLFGVRIFPRQTPRMCLGVWT